MTNDHNDASELFPGMASSKAPPPPAGKTASSKGGKAFGKAKTARAPTATGARSRRDAGATAVQVAASAIALHPSLGVDAAAFAASYTALIDEIVDEMRRGGGARARPQVVLDGTRYLAIDQVELVVAAGIAVARSPDLTMPVLLVDAIDPAHLVRNQLTSARGKSGWEQCCALAAIFAEGSVRETLRALDLKLSWESTVSRVLKLGRLDATVLEAVDPFTIPVKEGGQVVDAWQDEGKRAAMASVLDTLRGGSNRRLDAKRCFQAMLAVGRPQVLEPAWVDGEDGSRDYVAADGAVLATVSIVAGRWTAEGTAMTAAHWQAFGKQMPRPDAGR